MANLRIKPLWLQYDKEALRFRCFFQEAVPESPVENFRIRKCLLTYYFEDSAILIREPVETNSGLMQGPIVKRSKILKPDGTPYGPLDFKCGTNITIYSIVFRIVAADEFTRKFYKEHNLDIGVEEDIPKDAYTNYLLHREALINRPPTQIDIDIKKYNQMLSGIMPIDRKLRQHFANDRKVLRFNAYWDDKTRYGSRSYLVMHYFLADDTVEILESHQRNSGKVPWPVFFKRGELAKGRIPAVAPGQKPNVPLYKASDFQVGGVINTLGRELFIYDCDEFTRNYCASEFGITQGKIELPKNDKKLYVFPIPPYNGYGAEDDLGSMELIPKAPQVDMARQMWFSDKILRFEAKLVTAKPEDINRRFIIAFYLADDSIAAFELSDRNSGQMEGKFAEKGKKKKPDSGEYYTAVDLYVGATVYISAHRFEVVRADEFTLNFMEAHPDEFAFANVGLISTKIPSSMRGIVSADALAAVLVDHEIITLLRATRGSDAVDLDALAQLTQ